jgi:hypothetical protein
MKKYFLLLAITCLGVLTATGQKAKDALYLKNGSIIYGNLTEITDNQYKIKTSDGSMFIYQSSEVDKFLKESPVFDGRDKNGPGFSLEAGFLVGPQKSDYVAPFSFNMILNITSNAQSVFGIGTGVEYFGKSYTPFFLEYKYALFNRQTVPFIFTRAGGIFYLGGEEETNDYYYGGYSQPTTNYKGGLSFTLGTGISWAKEEYETYLSFAFRYAHTSRIEKNYNSYEYTYKNNFRRLEIKFGFKF